MVNLDSDAGRRGPGLLTSVKMLSPRPFVAAVTLVAAAVYAEESGQEPNCFKELDLTGCWSESIRGNCDECVAKIVARIGAAKLNCTDREEMAYCDGPEPKPGPVSPGCRLQLIKTCEPYGGNHGTVRACDECVEKNRPKESNCTLREELSFCLPEPPEPPPENVCEKDLMAACGKLVNVTGKEKECVACVAKIEKGNKECTKRQEETFCARPLPPMPPGPPRPPGPPGPATECEVRLQVSCDDERKKGMQACDACVKVANATLPPGTCTKRELLTFCEAGPAPTPPPPPAPARNPCEKALMASCEARRMNATECDACAKEIIRKSDGRVKCTKAEIQDFC